MEYKIDMSKCHGSIEGMGYLFNFDMSEGPDEEYASYLLNEYGVNSYCYYGGLTESSYCMCLWDETPIVSQRILDNNELNESNNMKKNIMKVNENALRRIIAESVKKVLKENNDGIQFELNTIREKIKSEFGVDGTIRMDGNDISLVFSGEKSDSHEGIYMSKFQIELLYRIFKECDALGEKMGVDTPIYVLPNGMISVYFV